MNILALELSSARGSLAAVHEGVDLVRDWANDRRHSGAFFENIEKVVREWGAPERIIVGLGPGSYAGTRIAISAAIGLQNAAGAQLLGYPSICAIECDEYCAIGDARRQSFFLARIRANELIEGPTLLSEADLMKKLDALDADLPVYCSEPLPQFGRALLRYPSAAILARLARDPDRAFVMPPLEPMYLREPHITVPRPI